MQKGQSSRSHVNKLKLAYSTLILRRVSLSTNQRCPSQISYLRRFLCLQTKVRLVIHKNYSWPSYLLFQGDSLYKPIKFCIVNFPISGDCLFIPTYLGRYMYIANLGIRLFLTAIVYVLKYMGLSRPSYCIQSEVGLVYAHFKGACFYIQPQLPQSTLIFEAFVCVYRTKFAQSLYTNLSTPSQLSLKAIVCRYVSK